MRVLVDYDGAGAFLQKIMAFEVPIVPQSSPSQHMHRDLDLDGDGEDVQLNDSFQQFSTTFSAPGAATTARIQVSLEGGSTGEEFAFDSFVVQVPQPAADPGVGSVAAADVGEPEIGDTSYTFTVNYIDDSAVDASTIDAGDVTVNGIAMNTGTTSDPTGSPLTATYTFTPPGGSWDSGDNGIFTIDVVGGEVGDDGGTQLFVPAGTVGSFTVAANNTPPVVNTVFALDIGAPDVGATSYSFTIEYADGGAVDASSIDALNVTVTDPGLALLTVTGGTTTAPNGPNLMATYTVTPPGGSWDAGDIGAYTIGVVGSQVFDVTGGSVAANPGLTTFVFDPNCIAQESFEGLTGPLFSTTGLISSPDQFYSGPGDFWTATDGITPDIETASVAPGVAYTGEDGNRYWAGNGLDDVDDNTDTVEFGPIPVAGFTNLAFSGLFAADGVAGGIPRYDAGCGLEVAWSIDGSPFVDALAFKSELAVGQNGNIRQDTDLDGVGDGAILGPMFSANGFTIPVTGTNLTIRLTGMSGITDEEFAFDALKVTGLDSGVNLPPTVSVVTAPDVGESELGLTSYSFDVVYSDDSGVDASTIDANDVTVNGIAMTTGTTADPIGSPLTATYTFTPPGGSWDPGDNGFYTIDVIAAEVGDTDGTQLFVAAGAIGSFTVAAANMPPLVNTVLALSVGAPDVGGTSYSFIIQYADGGVVDASSIDTLDVTVTGPGLAPLAVISGTTTDPNGPTVTAIYTVAAPGGSWDAGDIGAYTIGVVGSQVFDVTGGSVAANVNQASFTFDPNCIAQESFEGFTNPLFSTTGLISSPDQFYSGPGDFWTATDGITPDIETASAAPGVAYTGADGNRYWAGNGLDDVDDNTDTVVFGPIPVTGFTNLAFSGLFAADGVAGGIPRYDAGCGLEVAWSIDGSPFVDALAFKSELAVGQNGNIRQDTDLDGVGDGAILGPMFSANGFTIPIDGANLTIRLTGMSSITDEDPYLINLAGSGDDIIQPVITLAGDNPVTLECPTAYSEPGASVSDACDPSPSLIIDDTAVDETTPGTYIVTYSSTDASGNPAIAMRVVNVVDTTAPIITLTGGGLTLECGIDTFVDPGFSASDACEGDLTAGVVVAGDTVLTDTAGTYVITYDVSDSAPNAATQMTRTVTVVDTTPPDISCPDDIEVTAASPNGTPVTFAVTATDACDPAPVVSCTPPSGSLFPIGATTVNCTATDSLGQTATCSFVVTVISPEEMLDNLIDYVENLPIHHGLKNALLVKLLNALSKLEAAKPEPAINKLEAFKGLVEAQRGKKLTNQQSDDLIVMANAIIAAINPVPPLVAALRQNGATFSLQRMNPDAENEMAARDEELLIDRYLTWGTGSAPGLILYLKWEDSGILETTKDPRDPWAAVKGASSPYFFETLDEQWFFRFRREEIKKEKQEKSQ